MSTAAGPLTTLDRPGEIIPVALAAVQVYKGAAAAVVIGTGYGTPLVPTNVAHQFIGVWTETYNNTNGTAGGYFTKVKRKGIWAFSQTGTTITAAHIGKNAYFSDDNTVTLSEGTTLAGVICAVDAAANVWVDIENAVRGSSLSGKDWIALSGTTDAINPHSEANYIVTGSAVDAMTLAAPTSGIDDGVEIFVSSNTAYAHTITATGLLQTGATYVNVATFAAHPGAGVRLKAYAGKWNVMYANAITFS